MVLKNQWQAQPVAQPPVAAGVEALVAESALALVLAEAVSLAFEAYRKYRMGLLSSHHTGMNVACETVRTYLREKGILR